MKILLLCFAIVILPALAQGRSYECTGEMFLATDKSVDLFCIQASYPQVDKIEDNPHGSAFIKLKNGTTIPYASGSPDGLNADLASSMKDPYFLEPMRPDTPPGVSPGRKRPYEFLAALYGNSAPSVRVQTSPVAFLGKKVLLTTLAAQAFTRAIPHLMQDKRLLPWLAPEGGFYWRTIAGEKELSAHSFGIALDLGVKKAPYWRWSKIHPHPLQQTYPAEIVSALEREGFIWGGKWHEYDLMHFEYRPELICKARIRLAQQRR